jgi:hypothetical protein
MPRKHTPKETSELKKVLELINVGRKALKLKPLAEIPKGLRDDEDLCPLALAFGATIFRMDQDEKPYWCHCTLSIEA